MRTVWQRYNGPAQITPNATRSKSRTGHSGDHCRTMVMPPGSPPRPQVKGKHMRLSGPLVITGALGLAVLAVSVVAVWTSIDRVKAIRALGVKTTITLDPGIHETFAPPPADAFPAMTAQEASDA